MSYLKKLNHLFFKKNPSFFESKIKYLTQNSPKNLALYHEAFTHTANTSRPKDCDFERLEFLGDSILNAVVTYYLFVEKPNIKEGELTKLRSKIVRRKKLNEIGNHLNLTHYLVNFENQNLGKNIAGNLFESLIGALFLDLGFEKCQDFIIRTLNDHISLSELENTISSYKSFIHEWCQKQKIKLELFTEEENNANQYIIFSSQLKLDGEVFVKGRAKSKKNAEELACKRAYFALKESIENSCS